MRRWRIALWAVGLVALVCPFLLLDSDLPVGVPILCVVVGMACPPAAEIPAAHRARKARQAAQRDWYAEAFGSIEALRQSVDEPGLRRVRDEKGLANAVREVRRQHPRLPLDVAASLVRAL